MNRLVHSRPEYPFSEVSLIAVLRRTLIAATIPAILLLASCSGCSEQPTDTNDPPVVVDTSSRYDHLLKICCNDLKPEGTEIVVDFRSAFSLEAVIELSRAEGLVVVDSVPYGNTYILDFVDESHAIKEGVHKKARILAAKYPGDVIFAEPALYVGSYSREGYYSEFASTERLIIEFREPFREKDVDSLSSLYALERYRPDGRLPYENATVNLFPASRTAFFTLNRSIIPDTVQAGCVGCIIYAEDDSLVKYAFPIQRKYRFN